MNSVCSQKEKAFAVAIAFNLAYPELMMEIRNVIDLALETGASYEAAKEEIDQLSNHHRSCQAQEVAS